MPYKSFLIADFKTGQDLSKEPWLLPQDGFAKIENGYLHRGVLTKRLGYTEYGRLKNFDKQDLLADYTVVEEANTITLATNLLTNTVTTMTQETYVYKDFTADYFAGDFEHQFKINVTVTDPGVDMYIWLMGNLVDDAKGIFDANGDFLGITISSTGGVNFKLWAVECNGGDESSDSSSVLTLATDYWVTVKRDESVGTYGTLYCYIYSDINRTVLVDTLTVTLHTSKKDFRYLYAFSVYNNGGAESSSWTTSDFGPTSYPGLAVTGILDYYNNAGDAQLLVTDQKRLFKYNGATFEDITYVDTWDGANYNFVWDTLWDDVQYMTNNADQIQQYDGSTLSAFDIDIDGVGAANDVATALLIFPYKDRLVILNTVEGTRRAQRARWCKPNQPGDWTNDGYVDAGTIEHIVTAEFLGDDLIVFFDRSIWKLRYTADSDLPFIWEKLIDTEGAYATYSISVFSDELLVLGATDIVATDGLDAYSVGDKYPDFALNAATDKFQYCYSADLEELKQHWFSYASPGQETPDRVLVFNYGEKSWSNYCMDFLTFGFWQRAVDLTWDDVEEAWEDIEWAWDERTTQAGYPLTLAGNLTGYIYQLNETTTDDSAEITLTVKSGRWNPYSEQGQKARMGWIDFLMDVDPDVTLTVNFYKDMNPVLYKTSTFTCTGTTDKAWYRIPVGEIASFHEIEIIHSGKQQIKIHAVMPAFLSAGRMF